MKVTRSITFWSEFSTPSAEVPASEVSSSFSYQQRQQTLSLSIYEFPCQVIANHCFWPSQIHFPAPRKHCLSFRHCDGKMPAMRVKRFFTQAGYEKLAFNSQLKVSDCTRTQQMLQEFSNCRDSTSIYPGPETRRKILQYQTAQQQKKKQNNKTHSKRHLLVLVQ